MDPMLLLAMVAVAEPLQENPFLKLLLFNDSVDAWNARTTESFNANRTYTLERGRCKEAMIDDYEGPHDATDNLFMGGVNVTREVFIDGCGLIYAGDPVYFDGLRAVTWTRQGVLSLEIGVGCTTRTVNGSWDNFDANMAGSGYHAEYLAPVLEESIVRVNGIECVNDTEVHDAQRVHSVRILNVNCTVSGPTAFVELIHTCKGYVLVDSAYYVAGWVKECDRERFMKDCLEGCGLANTGGGECDSACCMDVCTDQANHKCMDGKSEAATCPNRPSGRFGRPSDGSNTYFIKMPRGSPADPCNCKYRLDKSNTCFNNRVTLAAGERYECTDEKEYVLDLKPTLSCNGSYESHGYFVRGRVGLNVDPDIATAFVVGDVLYRFQVFTPRHDLFGMAGSQGKPHKEYRLADRDYGTVDAHNDSDCFDFASMETTPNTAPPRVGKGLLIDNFSRRGGRYDIAFTALPGLVENLTITVLGIKDRIDRRQWTACSITKPCTGACIDEYCLGLDGFQNQTLRLDSCLVKSRPANLSMDATEGIEAGANVLLEAILTSEGIPLDGRDILLSCAGWTDMLMEATDSFGIARFDIMAGGHDSLCVAEYVGEYGFGSSRAERVFRVKGHTLDVSLWIIASSCICLIAIGYAVSEGRYKPYDILKVIWRLLR